jgi:hypothetical protein
MVAIVFWLIWGVRSRRTECANMLVVVYLGLIVVVIITGYYRFYRFRRFRQIQACCYIWYGRKVHNVGDTEDEVQ